MSEALTDDQRSSLASRFKAQFLPRMDATAMRADEKVREINGKQTHFALEVVKWFEKEMPECQRSEP